MTIWSKVFVGLIILLALPLFYYSARTLKTHQGFRQGIKQAEADIDRLTQENEKLVNDSGGIRELKVQAYALSLGRGRVWNGTHDQVDPQTGKVTVGIAAPLPHKLAVSTIVYVLESDPMTRDAQGNPTGGRYIGEFKVITAPDNDPRVVLEPAHVMQAFQGQRLIGSKPAWTIYEVMPVDSHETLAGLPADRLAMLLPPSTRAEYQRDGLPAEAADPPERVNDGKYVRMLRDYARHFREVQRQIAILQNELAITRQQAALLEKNNDDARKQIEFRNDEIQQTRDELAALEGERDQISQYFDGLKGRNAKGQEAIDAMLAENARLTAMLAEAQSAAVGRVDAETAAIRAGADLASPPAQLTATPPR